MSNIRNQRNLLTVGTIFLGSVLVEKLMQIGVKREDMPISRRFQERYVKSNPVNNISGNKISTNDLVLMITEITRFSWKVIRDSSNPIYNQTGV